MPRLQKETAPAKNPVCQAGGMERFPRVFHPDRYSAACEQVSAEHILMCITVAA